MKCFKYITIIALIAGTDPLLAMTALEKKEEEIAQSPAATKIQRAFRKNRTGIKDIAITENEAIKFFEVKPESINIANDAYYPTAESLTHFLNTYKPLKEYLPGLPEVRVEKVEDVLGVRNIGLFMAYRNTNEARRGEFQKGLPLFFLKISLDDAAPANLYAVQALLGEKYGIKTLSNRDLPIIVLQEMFFECSRKDDKKFIIEVMHIAHGKPLIKIIDAYDQNHQQWAEKVGRSFGLFHLEFMQYNDSKDPNDWRTMGHGDFNLGNLLFDEKTSRTYFIDNSDMRMTTPWIDLKFFNKCFSFLGSHAQNYVPNFKILNFALHFIKGYLSAYPYERGKEMAEFLKEKFIPTERPASTQAFISQLNEIFTEAVKQ